MSRYLLDRALSRAVTAGESISVRGCQVALVCSGVDCSSVYTSPNLYQFKCRLDDTAGVKIVTQLSAM